MAALRKQKSEDLQSARDSKDLRKQLDEMKDRNTALEQQMMEYTTTIQDQTKVDLISPSYTHKLSLPFQ